MRPGLGFQQRSRVSNCADAAIKPTPTGKDIPASISDHHSLQAAPTKRRREGKSFKTSKQGEFGAGNAQLAASGRSSRVLLAEHAGPAGADQFYDSSSDDEESDPVAAKVDINATSDKYGGGKRAALTIPATTERRLAKAATIAHARVLCDGDECVSGVSGAWEVVGKGDFVMVRQPLDAIWKAAGIVSVTHGGHSNAEFGLRVLETDRLVERVVSDDIRWVQPADRQDVLAAGLEAQRRWKALGQSAWTKMRAKTPSRTKPDTVGSAQESLSRAKQSQEYRAQQHILRQVQQAETGSVAASAGVTTLAAVGWMTQAPSLGPVWGMGIAKPTTVDHSVLAVGAVQATKAMVGGAGKVSGWRAKAAARKAARTAQSAT